MSPSGKPVVGHAALLVACLIVAVWLLAFHSGYRFGKDWGEHHFGAPAPARTR